VEPYLHYPIRLHGVVFNNCQGQVYITYDREDPFERRAHFIGTKFGKNKVENTCHNI
jgi:hypothetical protein